uniref:Uncharacterized protein n=1 Tax=Rhizophora mucronata TaxID=61149 RepID=A0A2P2Q298_RHIMU
MDCLVVILPVRHTLVLPNVMASS